MINNDVLKKISGISEKCKCCIRIGSFHNVVLYGTLNKILRNLHVNNETTQFLRLKGKAMISRGMRHNPGN